MTFILGQRVRHIGSSTSIGNPERAPEIGALGTVVATPDDMQNEGSTSYIIEFDDTFADGFSPRNLASTGSAGWRAAVERRCWYMGQCWYRTADMLEPLELEIGCTVQLIGAGTEFGFGTLSSERTPIGGDKRGLYIGKANSDNRLVEFDEWASGHNGNPVDVTLAEGSFPSRDSRRCWYVPTEDLCRVRPHNRLSALTITHIGISDDVVPYIGISDDVVTERPVEPVPVPMPDRPVEPVPTGSRPLFELMPPQWISLVRDVLGLDDNKNVTNESQMPSLIYDSFGTMYDSGANASVVDWPCALHYVRRLLQDDWQGRVTHLLDLTDWRVVRDLIRLAINHWKLPPMFDTSKDEFDIELFACVMEELPPYLRTSFHKARTDGGDGMLARPDSPVRWEQDRFAHQRPGRFLNQWCKGVMNPDMVRSFSESMLREKLSLSITTDQDKIEDIYVNGPSSCMSRPASEFTDEFASPHPARAYGGNPRIGLAYIEKAGGGYSARTVVNIEKKLYGHGGYGMMESLRYMLDLEGYSVCDGPLDGEYLTPVWSDRDNDVLLVPYIDGDANMFDWPTDKGVRVGYDCEFASQIYEDYVHFAAWENVGKSKRGRSVECYGCDEMYTEDDIAGHTADGEPICNNCDGYTWHEARAEHGRCMAHDNDLINTEDGETFANDDAAEYHGYMCTDTGWHPEDEIVCTADNEEYCHINDCVAVDHGGGTIYFSDYDDAARWDDDYILMVRPSTRSGSSPSVLEAELVDRSDYEEVLSSLEINWVTYDMYCAVCSVITALRSVEYDKRSLGRIQTNTTRAAVDHMIRSYQASTDLYDRRVQGYRVALFGTRRAMLRGMKQRAADELSTINWQELVAPAA